MSLHSYSADYVPAMPVCTIYVGAGGEEPLLGPLEALIDTGADITVVPMSYLRRLGVRPVGHGMAHSLWGDRRSVHVYAISLRLDNLHIRALQVLGDANGDEIVLGRTVLNRLYLVLDGPAAITETVEQRTIEDHASAKLEERSRTY
jgi:predicted aspartyl protease